MPKIDKIVEKIIKSIDFGIAMELLNSANAAIGRTPIKKLADELSLALMLLVAIFPKILFPKAISIASISVKISPIEREINFPFVVKRYMPANIRIEIIIFFKVNFSLRNKYAKIIVKRIVDLIRNE